MKNRKVMVAMSGGVDSSAAAHILCSRGYDCCGITMKLFQNHALHLPEDHACCSEKDAEDAAKVAGSLEMPFYVYDLSPEFQEKVVDRFVAAYERGETPNPCIDCNRYMKFGILYDRAMEIGCDLVATGHYARISYDEERGRYLLKKALDPRKDQSYVLYSMTQEQLSRTIFPLGEMTKTEVRGLAEKCGFANADKPESQDICFVPDGSYAEFIENYTGKTYPPGDFIRRDGSVLGRHRGIIRYTVGQRKGLGLALKKPGYVCGIDPEKNTVIIGDNEDLFTKKFRIRDLNLISCGRIGDEGMRLKVKVRYRQPEQWAVVTQTGLDTAMAEFDEPQRAITKGQSAVFYDGDVVVGGGVIC